VPTFKHADPPRNNKTGRIRGRITEFILATASAKRRITWRDVSPPLTYQQAVTNLRYLAVKGRLRLKKPGKGGLHDPQATVYMPLYRE